MKYTFLITLVVGVVNLLTLSGILAFFSGSDTSPPLGYDVKPVLKFDHIAIFPTAQTCGLQFHLPSKYSKPDMFRERMSYGIKNNGGFGLH